MTKIEKAMKISLIVSQPLDMLLTAIVILGLGGYEVNPMAAMVLDHPYGYQILLLIKLVFSLRIYMMKMERAADWIALGLATFIYLGVVGWNSYMVIRVLSMTR